MTFLTPTAVTDRAMPGAGVSTALRVASLRLTHVAHRAYGVRGDGVRTYGVRGDGVRGDASAEADMTFYTDMGTVWDAPFNPVTFTDAARNSAADMAADLAADLLAADLLGATAAPPVIELIVVAQSVPDVDIHRYAASELTAMIPGATLGFGVTDQGLATSFTALRIADAYAGGGAVTGVLVVLIDQSTIPFDTEVPSTLRPVGDAAVGLVFGPAGPDDGMSVRQWAGVAPADVPARLDAELIAMRRDLAHHVDTIMLGPGLDGFAINGSGVRVSGSGVGPVAMIRVPRGQPTTGLWRRLVDPVGSTGGIARVAVADYDATLGCLSIASLTVPPAA